MRDEANEATAAAQIAEQQRLSAHGHDGLPQTSVGSGQLTGEDAAFTRAGTGSGLRAGGARGEAGAGTGGTGDDPRDPGTNPSTEAIRAVSGNYRRVETVFDLTALGEWLGEHGDRDEIEPIGFAINQRELALVDRTSGWIIGTDEDNINIGAALRYHLCGARPPRLATRYLKDDIVRLAQVLGADVVKLAKIFVDGIDTLSYCTGRSYVSNSTSWQTAADDALDALINAGQLRLEAPPIYTRVMVPLRRSEAAYAGDPDFDDADRYAYRFKVTYDHLLLRVITHFTQDPLLIRLFTDEQYKGADPVAVLAEKLDIDAVSVLPFIVNLMVGEDEAAMHRHFPVQAAYVPANYGMVKVLHADKKLPTMRYGLAAALDEYRGSAALTLFGRHAPWGVPRADAAVHHYFGSVRDLLAVAQVTFENDGSFAMSLTEDGWGRSVFTGFTESNPTEFAHEMEGLIRLADPLIVPLGGRIFIDG